MMTLLYNRRAFNTSIDFRLNKSQVEIAQSQHARGRVASVWGFRIGSGAERVSLWLGF